MAKFKSDTERILEAISSSGSTFSEFCGTYSDTPERGDKTGWAALFRRVEAEVAAGHLGVDRDDNQRIDSMWLTDAGVAKLRALQQQAF
jgi:hypothetical protein